MYDKPVEVDNNKNSAKYLCLYKEMLRIQMVEDAIADNYNNEVREMHTPIHLCNGQEAIAVGICSSLSDEDVIFSNHRCHGHYLAKGGNLNAMIAELFSKKTGCCKGMGGSMHLADKSVGVSVASAIVAGNVSIATGYALAFKQQKKNNIAVVFLGDGATEEGSVYESICFAKIQNLPILYVCENNLYAISTGLECREPINTISDKFSNIIPTSVIDGNDILLINSVSQELIKGIRNGNGPAFLECKTYRLRDHHNVKTGVESEYRTQSEWDWWNEHSSVRRFKKLLFEKKVLNDDLDKVMMNEIKEEIEYAFMKAHTDVLPDIDQIDNLVWG